MGTAAVRGIGLLWGAKLRQLHRLDGAAHCDNLFVGFVVGFVAGFQSRLITRLVTLGISILIALVIPAKARCIEPYLVGLAIIDDEGIKVAVAVDIPQGDGPAI
jgi:hypothetical protein